MLALKESGQKEAKLNSGRKRSTQYEMTAGIPGEMTGDDALERQQISPCYGN